MLGRLHERPQVGIAGAAVVLQPDRNATARYDRQGVDMAKAVRFDEYGGIDVLQVADVPTPEPGDGQALIKVKAAGINPGEGKIRDGALHALWPATFPSGQGSDLAGVVERVGAGVTAFAAGDEVIGFTHDRASHAEYVVVPADHLTAKPEGLSWEIAGALFVAGATAWAAARAVAPRPGDTVGVSGAAGGVGSLVVQLLKRAGADVVGIASPANHDWLTAHGVRPVAYGEGLAERLREAKLDAFVDTHGDGYVKLALDLGIDRSRIDTIADFAAIEEYGVKGEGNMTGASPEVMAELADLVVKGELEVPIAATYPLSEVRAAFTELERGHTRGKIVLLP
jgi:NADPH:quinone reductase-like Zn-dependent oxidoreductase